MSTVSSVELEEIARSLASPRFDEHAGRALGRAYEEFVSRRRRALGPVALSVDGKAYPNFYAALADPGAKLTEGELRFERPAPADAWEFLPPFERIAFHADGSAELFLPGAPARRAIARVLLREHFVVRSAGEDAPKPGRVGTGGTALFGPLREGLAALRAVPILPFEVAVLLYFAEERARYEVDLVHGTLLADPRAGRLASGRRVRRSSRLAWGLDRRIGRGHLSLLAARSLEILVESNGLTAIDLGHVFGGVRELVDSALRALVEQGCATLDPRTGVYRPRLEAFLPVSEESAPAPAPPVRPELRSSVQELLAAADARASCPLCGQPLTGRPDAILCDDCAAKVGLL